ncbi:LysR family transcriptional regulator [Methyloparacoccus murrellii]|jgi:DNA-binding transcriptional LysR family regulator
MNITLRQLKVFERVARRLSFTRAAEELFLTQPAVSMQIKQFEEAVGLPLFERLGKKIYLTRAGEELYQLSRNIARQLDEAEQIIEELKGTESGRLNVAVASTVHYFAIRMLGEFCRRHPKVRVSFKVTNRKGLLQSLEDNEADLLLMGQPPESQELIAESFLINPLVIIAPAGHPLSGQKSLPLKALAGETFIMREIGSGTRNSVERFLADRGIHLTVSMEMNTNGAIKQGVEEGLGLGIVSLHTLERELDSGGVVVLDVESFPILRQWFMVHRAGKRLSTIATEFAEFVRQEAPHFVRNDIIEAALGHPLSDLKLPERGKP